MAEAFQQSRPHICQVGGLSERIRGERVDHEADLSEKCLHLTWSKRGAAAGALPVNGADEIRLAQELQRPREIAVVAKIDLVAADAADPSHPVQLPKGTGHIVEVLQDRVR